MKKETGKKSNRWWMIIGAGVILLVILYLVASAYPLPYRMVTAYPFGMLLEEANQMHECAECHETEDFHMCETCHNEHGSAVFAGLSFYSTVRLTGDVPREKFIATNQIFLEEEQEIGQITIAEFLSKNDVDDFASVTFASNDGGFTTIEKDQLSETSFLLPYDEGVRFADENLHISTWIKGVTTIIVRGNKKALTIDGAVYSIGELMLMDTVRFTVEEAPVMLKSEEDGIIRKGFTAERLEGIDLYGLLNADPSSQYTIIKEDGSALNLSGKDLMNSKIVLIEEEITLVFPEKSRNQWIFGVQSITRQG